MTRKTHSSRAGEIARLGRLAVMAVLVALMLGQGALATQAADDEITVMTRNLYQGADLGPSSLRRHRTTSSSRSRPF